MTQDDDGKWQPFQEPLRITLARTGAVALVVGAVLAHGQGRPDIAGFDRRLEPGRSPRSRHRGHLDLHRSSRRSCRRASRRQLRDTIVMLLTSIGDKSDMRNMEGSVVDACLVKPVRQSHLLRALTEAWSKRQKTAHTERSLPQRQPLIDGDTRRWKGSFADSHLRVLVAEDNVVNQKVATLMLER